MNFLIPEFVDHIDYQLGVYHPELGDFGSAGGAEFHLNRSSTVRSRRRERAERAGPCGVGNIEARRRGRSARRRRAKSYNGPWRSRGHPEVQRTRALLVGEPTSRFSLLAWPITIDWNASDQIPLRAVEKGAIDRFGYIDWTDGGNTAAVQPLGLVASHRRERVAGGAALRRLLRPEPVLELHVLPRQSDAG